MRIATMLCLMSALTFSACIPIPIPSGGRIHWNYAPVVTDAQTVSVMIKEIRAKITQGQFEFSRHAVDQSIIRHISVQEVREAIASGEAIEDYPDDKYGPSCLILGYTKTNRPLHIQCSYPSRPLIKIITLYEPNPELWIDLRARR